jgi:hypothetical protein
MNITIRPLGRGRFAASVGQRVLCKSKTPFFTAARIFQAEGVPDDTPITMRHEGSDIVAMRSTVGEAAGRIVVETDEEGPKFKCYRPMSPEMPRQRVRHEMQKADSVFAVPMPAKDAKQPALFARHLRDNRTY